MGSERGRLKMLCMDNLLAAPVERVYFKDKLSRFLFVSAGWVAAYAAGMRPGELEGKSDFDVFSYAHAQRALQDEREVMRTGRPLIGKVEQETFPGGRAAWVATTKMPLRDERGQVIGTFGISRVVPRPDGDG
jgi:hypothetical protein